MNFFKIILIVLTVFAFLVSCSSSNMPRNTEVANNNAPVVNEVQPVAQETELASGKELYAANCIICHKDSGKGGKVTIEGKTLDADDLTSDRKKKLSDDKLFSHISEGSPDDGMPSFKGKLKDEEIRSIVNYVRTLQAG